MPTTTSPPPHGLLHRLYGAGLSHLLGVVVALAAAAFAVSRLLDLALGWRVFAWLGGAIVLHDFVLLPAYTGLHRLAHHGGRVAHAPALRVPVLHHVLAPAALSAALALVWLPLLVRSGEATFQAASGLSTDPYLERWLAISAALFAASALVYGVRWLVLPGGRPAHAHRAVTAPHERNS